MQPYWPSFCTGAMLTNLCDGYSNVIGWESQIAAVANKYLESQLSKNYGVNRILQDAGVMSSAAVWQVSHTPAASTKSML